MDSGPGYLLESFFLVLHNTPLQDLKNQALGGGPAVDPKKQWWARRGPEINNRIE